MLFFQHPLPYLGHIIDNGKITLDPSRIKAMHEFPVLTTVKSLHSFLGMAQFCDHVVSHFSAIATPDMNLQSQILAFNGLSSANKPLMR